MAEYGMTLRQSAARKLEALRTYRWSWWAHWGELAEYILPRRYMWVVTPNKADRGSPVNRMILDSTGTLSARNLASGMMADITSPTRPWFKLRITGADTDVSQEVSEWLAECENRVYRVLSESNYYTAKAQQYFDLVVFGTAPMIIYEDYEDVIRCYNPCAGEYFLAVSDRMAVDTMYREFVLTIAQVVEWFGIENCSDDTAEAWKRGGGEAQREIVIAHAIEPNVGRVSGGPAKSFEFREIYRERDRGEAQDALSVRGFHELPFGAGRWDLVSNDAYGRSPAMDALPDIKQLQQETKRKAQAIDKMVNPPMVADVQMKNQPASALPGGITYVAGASNSAHGFRPAYQIQPQIQELMLDIAEVQKRIRDTFFNDLFLMISQLEGTHRTATEIDARREEKLVMLGPVLERIQNECLDPDINRIFNIMERAGLIPEPPAEIQGAPINVQYVSILASAQRAASTAAIERIFSIVGSVAALDPAIMDTVDDVEAINEYASLLNVPPKIMRDPKMVAEIRAQRAQEKAGQEALQTSTAVAQGAKTLSETQLGAGVNALQLLQGGAAR